MEHGSLRCDVNVSLQEFDQEGKVVRKWPRCEIKNVVSVHALKHAIEAELGRQYELISMGSDITMQTFSYDLKSRQLCLMRSKEQTLDYRYMPDPDLPTWGVESTLLNSLLLEIQTIQAKNAKAVRESMEKQVELQKKYPLTMDEVQNLVRVDFACEYFSELVLRLTEMVMATPTAAEPTKSHMSEVHLIKLAYNWFVTELFAQLNRKPGANLSICPVRPVHLARLVYMFQISQRISKPVARRVLSYMMENDSSIEEAINIVQSHSSFHEADIQLINSVIQFIDNEAPTCGEDVLVFKVMKKSQKRLNVHQVKDLIRERSREHLCHNRSNDEENK